MSKFKLAVNVVLLIVSILLKEDCSAQDSTQKVATVKKEELTQEQLKKMGKNNVITTVYTINLCNPDIRSVSNNTYNSKLYLKNKNLLSLVLTNCNTKKYIYRINSEPVAFNTDATDFKQLIDSVKKNFFSTTNAAIEVAKEKETKEVIKFTKDVTEALDKRVGELEKKFPNKVRDSLVTSQKSEILTTYANISPEWFDEPSDYNSEVAKRLIAERQRKRLQQQLLLAANDILRFEANVNRKDNVTTFPKEPMAELIDRLKNEKLDIDSYDPYNDTTAINDEFYTIINNLNERHTTLLTDLNNIVSEMKGECIEKSTLDKINVLKKSHFDDVLLYSKFRSLYNYRKVTSTFMDEAIANGGNMEEVITTTLDNYSSLNTSVSPPFPVSTNNTNTDLIRVKIERIDIKTQLSKDVTYDFWIRGGVKIDFSAGIFATSLKDEEYYFKDDPDSAGQKAIFSKDNGKYNFGFGSMMNVMARSGASWFTPGFSLGAIFTTQQKFQILTAASVAIGKQERIVIHGGVALGFAKRLDRNYTASSLGNETYYDFGENATLIPTDDRFKAKAFWGITYNLTAGSPFKSIGK